MKEVSGGQIRAARAFLRWSIAELAERAGVGISTVQAIEAAEGAVTITGGLSQTLEHRAAARAESIASVCDALVKAGCTFLPDDGHGDGVRAKGRTLHVTTTKGPKTLHHRGKSSMRSKRPR